MGSCISRIDEVYSCYVSFCEELNEIPKDYKDIEKHTGELIEKYSITKNMWWYHNAT